MISFDDEMRPQRSSTSAHPSIWGSAFKGRQVEVRVGYDISVDAYRAHVYVTAGGGERQKVPLDQTFATENDATRDGFAAAERAISNGLI